MSDKTLKEKGRGLFDLEQAVVNDVGLAVTKWYDNKSVVLLSTFVGVEPVTTIDRFDNVEKRKFLFRALPLSWNK